MNISGSARALGQWLLLGAIVGGVCGVASAVFLALLEEATEFRLAHESLVYALPLAGLVLGAVYGRWGASIKGGNNLVLDTVHEGDAVIPLRMAPMVLLGTVLTHLFGGSAGREGTAVQMGASLADQIAWRFRVAPETRRELLAAGIAGGFGSVFGTPLAGTVFGLEVVCVGRLGYEALLPALTAAVVGDLVTRGLGIHHTAYPVPQALALTLPVLGKWLVFAVGIAGVAVAFIEGTHGLKRVLERRVPWLPVRMALGGLGVVGLWKLAGTSDYLGLGVPGILRAFEDVSLPWGAFAWKLVFTVVTLGAGFLGGEVTPLFFIGAALGNVLARLLGLPVDLGAAVGMAALFAAAANTPLALSLMAVELVGASVLPHVAIVATVAYLLTGHRGIYPSQRIARKKLGGPLLNRVVALRDLHEEPRKESEAPR
ncbi:chloride channel protein [Corallococcus sp. AB004]|uniref:chloride channel protein n=1 Tax=Corallococcus TaxID=83461 RepID=UPI000EA25C72|nr:MULTISPECIES: chloride channel protein [Corallococcus]NPD25675.1 chloride channel protein [Corallococcus exiguus]NRD45061.1 chloride channel protein [Corallococcus exiguus]RKH93164.1 chloride channel protein [Corallococcus sp. AB038B]RKI41711.1 chloride channel protein [Corallococcus sp. AB004]